MSPRTSAQFDAIRQRSRKRIMDAALELFGTLGYQATSISKIAQAAGISKGLMYNYFSGKQELLEAIIIEEVEQGTRWWHEVLEKDVSAYEKIRQLTFRAVEAVKEDTHHWRLLTSLAFQPNVMENIEPIIMEQKGPLIAESINLFAQLGVPDPEKEAFFYGAMLDGFFLHYLSSEAHYPLVEMIEYAMKRYEAYDQKE